MKIRTQLIISAVVFAAILLACLTTVVVGNRTIQQIGDQEDLAKSLQQDANELGFITNSYLLFHDQSQLTLWQSKENSLSRNLAALKGGNQQQQNLINDMRSNQQRMTAVFIEIKTDIGNNPVASGSLDYVGTAYSRLAVQNQGFIADANQLALLLRNQVVQIEQRNSQLIFILFIVFGLVIIANFILINRRVAGSLSKLLAGTKTIGSGNLDYRVPVKGNDELGELSGAFNQMTSDLKSVTSSKRELEKEIEQRKKAEKALQESEREYKSLAENIPDVVTRYDKDLHYIFANTAAGQAAGISTEAFIGKTNLELGMDPEQVEFWMKHVRNVFTTGKPDTMEFQWQAPDGLKYQQTIITPEFDSDGSVKTVLCITHNLTELKRTEESLRRYTSELETANKELESFSYSVSHDLRAPLRTLDGFSEMMLEEYGDRLDEDGKDYLNRIRKASQTMSELIDAILNLSRISRAEMHRDQVDLSDLARSILEGLKQSQPERRAEIIIAPELRVNGDLALLRVALNNLLENAWKYTRKCPQTRIELGKIEEKGEKFYFIKDNGIGFDMKYQDKLFQPFQRLHTSNEYPGTGIGLATVQRVIHRHNGRIWAESEVGKGSTFYFTLG
jgi:PAS domain S-box-containing protein